METWTARLLLLTASVGIWAGCEHEGVGAAPSVPGPDSGPAVMRMRVGTDAGAPDVLAVATPDALAAEVAVVGPEVGRDSLVAVDALPAVVPDALAPVGPDAQVGPEVGELPATCSQTPRVKAVSFCDGYWPSDPPTLCAAGCQDADTGKPVREANPLLGCFAAQMLSSGGSRPIVCLGGWDFCAIYCPVVK
jgi:hypothetical protein